MQSTLALFFCLIFVAALLKLDHQRFKPRSFVSWIPTLWMLHCASKPFPYWFASGIAAEDITVIEGSPMDRNFLMILIVAGIVVLSRRKTDWNRVILDNQWLFLLFTYMLVSILWSDYPFVSLKRWFKASGTIVMALVVLTGASPLEELKSILRRTIFILIPFSVLLVKYFPQLGMEWGRWSGATMWAGVTTGKNSLGALCMISALYLIWEWAKSRKQTERSYGNYEMVANLMVLGMTFWLLRGPGGAYSATSIIVLIIGLATLFILRRLRNSKYIVIMACLFLFATGLGYLMWESLSFNPFTVVASLMGRAPNLTGRTDMIWSPLISVAMKHPVLGLGYGGFWIHPMEFDKFTVNQAHNGYLDVFIELGAVGLILLTVVIVMFFRKAVDVFKYDIEWGSFQLSFLLMSLVHNITESSYLKSTILVWITLIMLMVAYPIKTTRHNRI